MFKDFPCFQSANVVISNDINTIFIDKIIFEFLILYLLLFL